MRNSRSRQLHLQAYGLDVWMYDYRGFGQSDDFAIVQNQLFHMEFVKDLDAVAKYIYQKTGKSPALLGISMGTIIVNEYLRVADIHVSKVVFDGYVSDPKAWNSRLAANGKQVVKTFDCEHISGFFRYPEEYTTAIVDFLK